MYYYPFFLHGTTAILAIQEMLEKDYLDICYPTRYLSFESFKLQNSISRKVRVYRAAAARNSILLLQTRHFQ